MSLISGVAHQTLFSLLSSSVCLVVVLCLKGVDVFGKGLFLVEHTAL